MKAELKYLIAALLVFVLTACTNDDFLTPLQGVGTCRMFLDVGVSGYDGGTRAGGEHEWHDGDSLYIQFSNSGSPVTGNAVYSAGDGEWTLSYSGTLAVVESHECSVYFFDNAVHKNGTQVELTPHSTVYECKVGKYSYNGKDMSLSAHLSPKTGRVRFVSGSEHSITVCGVSSYTSFNLSDTVYTASSGEISLTSVKQGSGCFTDYVYGFYTDAGTRKITVRDIAGVVYEKSCPEQMFSPARSGYMTIPTGDSHEGWEVIKTSVDLGLSIKWATCNVGASKPEEYGGYYAWGETEEKSDYIWETYKWCKGSEDTFTKYCTSSDYGTVDNKSVLDPEDDVAHVKWGGSWRMPTVYEIKELKTECTWTWTTQNGVNGYRVTGPNGNSIFLPAAGYRGVTGVYGRGSGGYYWSSSLRTSYGAYLLYFHSGYVHWNSSGSRCNGESVRPVDGESKVYYSVSVSTSGSGSVSIEGETGSSVSVGAGSSVTVKATPTGGYIFTGWYVGSTLVSSDASYTFVVSENVSLVAKFEKRVYNGHEYVDLGLPSGIKWATCNVGATKPEDYGGYYAWGETEEKSDYSWETYKWCKGSKDTLTKYCTSSDYGTVDNKSVLDLEDDVAHVKWGGGWRMPTVDEINELKTKCKWAWTTQNGVNGYRVTGPNGNSIFLPAAGYRNGTDVYSRGSYGYYWSSSLLTSSNYSYNARYLHFESGIYFWSYINRYNGQSVRPVYGEYKVYYFVSVSTSGSGSVSIEGETGSSVSVVAGSSVTVKATPTGVGYIFTGWYVGSTLVSSDASYTFVVSENVSLVAKFEKETETPDYNGHEYVDLGLFSGIKWATCNVGATKPEDYGGYYAWGETEEKSDYDWETYKWCKGSEDTFTKYCTSSDYGTVDNKSVLDPEDDVAHVKWGGSWRMPTYAEQNELIVECDWAWTTQNGVNGYRVTGPNGNSIFLPAAGVHGGTGVHSRGSDGNYWSSSLNTSGSYSACYLKFYKSGYVDWGSYARYNGLSVRPVSK